MKIITLLVSEVLWKRRTIENKMVYLQVTKIQTDFFFWYYNLLIMAPPPFYPFELWFGVLVLYFENTNKIKKAFLFLKTLKLPAYPTPAELFSQIQYLPVVKTHIFLVRILLFSLNNI